MTISSRLLRLLAATVFCFATEAQASNDASIGDPKPGYGVVLLESLNITPLSLLFPKWKAVRLKNVETGKTIEIGDSAPQYPIAFHSLFLGKVPQGKWQVDALAAEGGGFMFLGRLGFLTFGANKSDHADQLTNTFTVSESTFSNLGIVLGNMTPDDTYDKLLLSNEQAQRSALNNVDDAARQALLPLPVKGWDQEPDPDADSHATAMMRKYSKISFLTPIQSTPDGGAVFGSLLGLIELRRADGTWDSLPTGTYDRIVNSRVFPDGTLFAVSSFGEYFIRKPKSDHWQSGSFDDREFSMASVEQLGEQGFVVSGVLRARSDAQARAFRIQALAPSGDSYAATDLLRCKYGWVFAPVLWDGTEAQIFANCQDVKNSKIGYIPATGAVTAMPNNLPTAKGFVATSDGKFQASASDGNYVSADNGRSWEKQVVEPVPLYHLEKVSGGWSTVTFSVGKSNDGGKTWKRIGTEFEVNNEGAYVAILVSNTGRLYVNRGGPGLYSSDDEGVTWHREWPVK